MNSRGKRKNNKVRAFLAMMLTMTLALIPIVGFREQRIEDGEQLTFLLRFVDVSVTSSEEVAATSAELADNGRAISVRMINAYPGYEARISYTIRNLGDVPARINGISIENSEVISITMSRLDQLLQPGGEAQGVLIIRMLDGAEEGVEYRIVIRIEVIYQEIEIRSSSSFRSPSKVSCSMEVG